MTGVCIRRGEKTQRHRKIPKTQAEIIEGCIYKAKPPRTAGCHQKPREAWRKQIVPQNPQKKPTLLTP